MSVGVASFAVLADKLKALVHAGLQDLGSCDGIGLHTGLQLNADFSGDIRLVPAAAEALAVLGTARAEIDADSLCPQVNARSPPNGVPNAA